VTSLPVRGSIIYVDLGEPVGHEAGYERPALVVSHDRLARTGLITVLAVTRTRLGWPSHVEVEAPESGLKETSYIQTEQVRTISTDRIVQVLPTLSFTTIGVIDRLLRTNLDLG
jgi:mRNA interferase MazF